MLAQIHQRLQDASNEVQENGAIAKHLHEEQEGKDEPTIQTSQKKTEEKESELILPCLMANHNLPAVKKHKVHDCQAWQGVTSKVKPFHGVIFLGSHPTETEPLRQTGQQECTRS